MRDLTSEDLKAAWDAACGRAIDAVKAMAAIRSQYEPWFDQVQDYMGEDAFGALIDQVDRFLADADILTRDKFGPGGGLLEILEKLHELTPPRGGRRHLLVLPELWAETSPADGSQNHQESPGRLATTNARGQPSTTTPS
jgi:hypothetical protein